MGFPMMGHKYHLNGIILKEKVYKLRKFCLFTIYSWPEAGSMLEK